MKSPCVLIIDDNHLIRYTTSLLLRQLGFESKLASSGQQGLEMAKAEPPDAILLDIMMPDMDGWEVLAIIEKIDSLNTIPIILFTALEEQLFRPQAEGATIRAILQKPFRLEELISALRIALPNQELS